MRIFLQQTDESHTLSTSDIIDILSENDIEVERKTVYNDIETLRSFGLDILLEKGIGYYVASRDFELPELKLLVDAVVSSKFITEKKSLELIGKLKNLVSVFDAGKLARQVHVQNRVKTMNESIYYNVDALHEAIAGARQVSFKYFDYNIKKERVFRHDGKKYKVSPVALLWDNENYYLVAKSDDHKGFTHYRVDKMASICLLDEKRDENANNFNPADYSKKIFGMFGGSDTGVSLRFDNSIAGVVIDRFGKNVTMIPDGDDGFIVNVKVVLSPVFYGWLFQFGELCEVVSPRELKELLREHGENFIEKL